MTTRPMTKRQRQRFLEHLAETLNVTAAAKAAGVHRATAYRLRDRDAVFRQEWDAAIAEAVDRLEAQAFKFAIEGAEERTYDADGKLVSRRVREDPATVARLLAAHRPDQYSERRRVELAGRIDVDHQVAAAGPVISIGDVIARHRELETAGSPTTAEVVDEGDEAIDDESESTA